MDAAGPVARARLYGVGLWLMAPAPALLAVALALLPARAGVPWGYLVAPLVALLGGLASTVGGVLLLAGLALAGVGTYRTRRFPVVAAGLAVASGSLFVLGTFPVPVALLYAGVGLVVLPACRFVAAGPVAAGLAAAGLFFLDRPSGIALTAAGSAALAVVLALAGRDALRDVEPAPVDDASAH